MTLYPKTYYFLDNVQSKEEIDIYAKTSYEAQVLVFIVTETIKTTAANISFPENIPTKTILYKPYYFNNVPVSIPFYANLNGDTEYTLYFYVYLLRVGKETYRAGPIRFVLKPDISEYSIDYNYNLYCNWNETKKYDLCVDVYTERGMILRKNFLNYLILKPNY